VSAASTASDSNAGTQVSPVKTIGHAMDLAKAANKRVYACGNAGSYTAENLVVGTSRDGVDVFGGLDCTTTPTQWAYNAADKATVAPTTAGYALQLTGLTAGVTFEDFAFTSIAGASTGQSSIAVFASGSANVLLERCTVQAGAGQPGQGYGAAGGWPSSAPVGSSASGVTTANPSCSTSIGGAGAPATAGGANGGSGEPGLGNGQTPTGCSNGDHTSDLGANGNPGEEGAGASSLAAFAATGWTPASGSPGTAGTVGQGGGGGGSLGVTVAGSGGGAGGCGGALGLGGGGGGSSIAVLSYDSTIDLEACTLQSANAGPGGNGGGGQSGQPGGAGGTGVCSGGLGGTGGNGGSGGGGAGGVSAGVMWTGTAPTVNGASTPSASTLTGVTVGTAGGAGTGGSPAAVPGSAGAVVQF
jgi:hypothetical protein